MKIGKLAVTVIILGTLIRLFRFPELLSFSYEQALALEASAKMLETGKLSLIGVEYFIRQTASGHSFFNSAFYLYPLSLVQIAFGYDPLSPTLLFLLLNLASGVGLFLLAQRYLGKGVGLISLILFMFSPIMVSISRYVWHLNLLVPVIVLSIWLTYKSFESSRGIWFVILGVSLGLGFGFHISFSLWVLITFVICFVMLWRRKKISSLLLILFGFLLGNLPTIIFDLRHDFYNLRTMLTFLRESLRGGQSGFSFQTYHFVYFIVPLILILSQLIHRRLSSKFITLILMGYLLITASFWNLFAEYPKGMPSGTNLNYLKQISSLIVSDSRSDFEVASIVDGETRAENLRYILKYLQHKPALGYDKYPEADILYVISYRNQNPLEKDVWEINSLKPATVSSEWQINPLIKLTKIQRIK